MASPAEEQIAAIVLAHRVRLEEKVAIRREELLSDDVQHYEVYRVLGIPQEECPRIDLYQNIGRFVYKYAGALLEDATKVLLGKGEGDGPLIIPNTVSSDPQNFHIDCFTQADNRAHEIKWRDATTDGDHIKKEHNKIRSIIDADHIPVRVMFYLPVRSQALRIQEKIVATFKEEGYAYVGDDAWEYVKDRSGVDLRTLLSELTPCA